MNVIAMCRFVPLLLLMLGLPPALALESAALRIITVEEPPASYVNEHGLVGGYATELVRALQQQLGDHSVIEVMPESRALLTAQQQANVLLFGFSRIASREQAFHWVMPLLHKRWIVYVRQSDPLQVASLQDLHALESIGVVQGDVRGEWLQALRFTNLQRSSSHLQNLHRLQAGRLRAIAYESQGMQMLIQDSGMNMADFRPLLEFNRSEVWLMMSRLTTPSEVARWQRAAAQLQASGQQRHIAEKWQQLLLRRQIVTHIGNDGLLQF